jgi:hypothetical protein
MVIQGEGITALANEMVHKKCYIYGSSEESGDAT